MCNDNGDTPIMIAYRAGVSDRVMAGILRSIATQSITNFLNIKNVRSGKSFLDIIKEEFGPEAGIFINVYTDFQITKPTESAEEAKALVR